MLAIPIAVPLMALGVFVVRGCESADVPNLTAPPGVELPTGDPTTTAPEATLTNVALAPVDGTTTTVPWPTSGNGYISGVVRGPDGAPIAGAFVHIERVVPGARALGFDVGTGPDGRYELGGAPGGRYRIRAYLPPTLAQTVPTTFFLGADEQRQTDLEMDHFSGLTVQVAVAPVPPMLNQPVNLKVQVTNKQVDIDGVVRAVPVAGAAVQLTSTGQWVGVTAQPTGVTGPTGDVTFPLSCRTAGPNSIALTVRPNAVDPPIQQSFDVGVCEAPPPSTTTTSPPITLPPAPPPPPPQPN